MAVHSASRQEPVSENSLPASERQLSAVSTGMSEGRLRSEGFGYSRKRGLAESPGDECGLPPLKLTKLLEPPPVNSCGSAGCAAGAGVGPLAGLHHRDDYEASCGGSMGSMPVQLSPVPGGGVQRDSVPGGSKRRRDHSQEGGMEPECPVSKLSRLLPSPGTTYTRALASKAQPYPADEEEYDGQPGVGVTGVAAAGACVPGGETSRLSGVGSPGWDVPAAAVADVAADVDAEVDAACGGDASDPSAPQSLEEPRRRPGADVPPNCNGLWLRSHATKDVPRVGARMLWGNEVERARWRNLVEPHVCGPSQRTRGSSSGSEPDSESGFITGSGSVADSESGLGSGPETDSDADSDSESGALVWPEETLPGGVHLASAVRDSVTWQPRIRREVSSSKRKISTIIADMANRKRACHVAHSQTKGKPANGDEGRGLEGVPPGMEVSVAAPIWRLPAGVDDKHLMLSAQTCGAGSCTRRSCQVASASTVSQLPESPKSERVSSDLSLWTTTLLTSPVELPGGSFLVTQSWPISLGEAHQPSLRAYLGEAGGACAGQLAPAVQLAASESDAQSKQLVPFRDCTNRKWTRGGPSADVASSAAIVGLRKLSLQL